MPNNILSLIDSVGKQISDSLIVNKSLLETYQKILGGISEIDTSGCYKFLNDEYANTCGYTTKEMVGMNWEKTVYPEDLEAVKSCVSNMTDKPAHIKLRGVRKDWSVFLKQIHLVKKEGGGHYCFMKEVFDS